MGLLTDMPYSVLKENERAYEVMIMRDQNNNSYSDMAKKFELSSNRVLQIYYRTKMKQVKLYARYLAIVNRHESNDVFTTNALYECYWDFKYVAAYYEKEYRDILTEYRAGEPGMPEKFIAMLPPYIKEISVETTNRAVHLREVEKKTYMAIGKELLLTEAKAKREYEMYYHKKVMALEDKIKDKIKDQTGKGFWDYFDTLQSSKKQYEMLIQNFPGLLDSE